MLGLCLVSLGAAFVPELRGPVVVQDALLLALVLADFLRTPRPARLRPRRSLPERIGLSAELPRLLRVVPGRAAGLLLEVREELPESFEAVARGVQALRLSPFDDPLEASRRALAPALPEDPTGGPDRVRLIGPGASELEIPRLYRPSVRGVHALGDLRLRLRSPLGLVWRSQRFAASQAVAVVPPLAGLSRTLRLAASERWHELGVRRTRRRGALTTDFESLRDYVHGDDARLVDWKATARRGRPTVRQFQVERGQELILLVDCGRRMAATTSEGQGRGWSKLDHALDCALQLSAVALQQGDRVGLLAYDSQVRAWVPPSRGARALERLMQASFDLAPRRVEADLARALSEARVRHRRRALFLVLSDVGPPSSAEATRRALQAAGTAPLVFAALDDPEVRAMAEGRRPGGPQGAALRASALHLCEERRQALAHLSSGGVRVLDPLPAEAAAPLLAAWLELRRGEGHGAGGKAASLFRTARGELA